MFVLALVKVPVPDVVQLMVPLLDVPSVMYVEPAQIAAVAGPAFAAGQF